MSSSDVALSVRKLSKAYTIRHNVTDHITLAELAVDRLKHPLRRAEREQFWALRDVTFEVKKGEVLGLIGRNGAGKSTLLKILGRITDPTQGEVHLWGRVGLLLEVGTGFHPELTGRENVYLNGSILGMSHQEINRQFDAIVEFAGIEKFLDTPVKRFSSGMYVRLAFAVAAHLETDILLVDEVLAVGDVEFQKKCLGKMHDVAVEGRTVLFVSHQLESVAALCDLALRLDAGAVHSIGPPQEMIASYLADLPRSDVAILQRPRGSGEWQLAEVTAPSGSLRVGQTLQIHIVAEALEPLPMSVFPSITVMSMSGGQVVAHCDGRRVGGEIQTGSHTRCEWEFELRSPWFRPGEYAVSVHLCTMGGILDQLDPAMVLTVIPQVESAEVKTLEYNIAETVADFSLRGTRAEAPQRDSHKVRRQV